MSSAMNSRINNRMNCTMNCTISKQRVSLTIDGQPVSAGRGANLLQAALEAGFLIPSLCWHRKLSPTGACRLCLVKIEGLRGLVTSCSIEAAEGMQVTAFDEELEQVRKNILSYLLFEVETGSDGTFRDELAELAQRYGLDSSASAKNIFSPFSLAGLKGVTVPQPLAIKRRKVDTSSPVLTFDSGRCISCFRCIKACEEVQGKGVLSFEDRGIEGRIIAGNGVWRESECDGCGECVQLCPTGAIVEKPWGEEISLSETKVVTSTCPYCGVGCQLDIFTQKGKIVRVNGREEVYPNDGRLCVKGRFGYGFVSSPERLSKPLIKENGKFREAEWDEALKKAAQGFLQIKQSYGPAALAGYSSAKCTNEENYLFQKFVRTVFGTNNLDYCTRLCHASTVTAMLQALGDGAGSNSIQDFETTDCIFVIGNNIIETHPVTATYVKGGASRGAGVIVVDPKQTPLAETADLWLQPKLGTDVALLNGIIHIILKNGWIDRNFIEKRVFRGMKAVAELESITSQCTPKLTAQITSVPVEKLFKAAELYAKAPRAIIATGMGLSQQVTGTHNVFCLINMMLITGQIGKEGAGIDPPRGQNNVQGATDVGCSPLFYPGYIPAADENNRRKVAKIWGVPFETLPKEKGLSTVEIMHAAGEGKIKGMYIMGENPLHTDPNLNHTFESIKKLDFLVVQDIFMTPTAECADIVLPAASFAEKEGTFVNSDRRVLRVRQAVQPPGQALADSVILMKLAQAMGQSIGDYREAADIFTELTRVTPIIAGIDYTRIEHEGIQWPCPAKDHPGTGTLFLEKFNTEDGLARIIPVEYTPQNEQPDSNYPLLLNSGRLLYHYHSSTMSRRSYPLNGFVNESYCLMNPQDASALGLADRQKIKVSSKQGSITTFLHSSEQVALGELFMPFHFEEALVNRLTRDEMDPYSKIAPFKLTACRVESVDDNVV